MFEFLKRNSSFALLLFAWAMTGMYLGSLAGMAIVVASVLLLKTKGFYAEILWGFMFVLALSDSRLESMKWAGDSKNLIILLIAMFYFFDSKHFNYQSKIFVPFVLLFVWAMLLVYRNSAPLLSGQKAISYILLFICIPPYFTKLLNENGIQVLKDTIHFIAWILFAGILLLPFLSDYMYFDMGRFNGLLGNPNGIGIMCTVLFFLFHISKNKFPDLFDRNESYFVYGIIIFSLYLCGSRNSMMSILLFLLFSNTQRISPWISFFMLVAIAFGYQMVMDNLGVILHSVGLDKALRADTISEASGRLIAWKFAWLHIQQNFFVGMGWDYDNQLFLENYYYLSALGHNGGVHNVTLAFWLNLGLIGVILFYYAFLKTFFNASKYSIYALPMMFATLFSITFETWLMSSLNPFTIIFVLSLVVLSYEPKPAIEETRLVPV